MKLLRYGATHAYVGEYTAALLLDYEQLLTRRRTADALSLKALVGDGDDFCTLRVLVGLESPLRVEAANDDRVEPDNRVANLHLKERIAWLSGLC